MNWVRSRSRRFPARMECIVAKRKLRIEYEQVKRENDELRRRLEMELSPDRESLLDALVTLHEKIAAGS